MNQNPQRFIFVACQKGAQTACKQEILCNHPSLKLAFSRPGFVTFKCDDTAIPEKFNLKTSFARTFGWCVDNFKIENVAEQIEELCQNELLAKSDHLHVFERDSDMPGARGFEPGVSVLATEIGNRVHERLSSSRLSFNRIAKSNELIFNIIMVEPNQWFIGYHFAQTKYQRWPGGVPKVDLQHPVISRAYYKLREALLWSGIRISESDYCAEIGASPGGACQLLLEKGAQVIAIDPAELDDEIAKHPNLTYIRSRGREVRKRELKNVRWLICDINVAPNYSLDTIEEIVTNQHCQRIRGLILTLKITDWKMAEEISTWKQRVRKFGFQVVKTRQLAFNRKEICLVAVRDKFALRASRKSHPKRRREKGDDD